MKDINKITFFDNFSSQELLNFIRISQRCFFDQGEYIYKEGDSSDNFHIICTGNVSVTVSDSNEQETEITEVGAGSIIGEVGFTDQKFRNASIKCLEYTSTLLFSLEEFNKLEDEDPKLALKIIKELSKILSGRLRWCDKVIVNNVIPQINVKFLEAVENISNE